MKNLLKCNPLQHPCNKRHLCEVFDTEEWTVWAGSLGFYCVASVKSYKLHMDFCDVVMGRCSSSIILCSSGGSALKSVNDALMLPGLAEIGLKSLNRTHALQGFAISSYKTSKENRLEQSVWVVMKLLVREICLICHSMRSQ